MGLFDLDKNSLPEQVQQNKEDIKDIKDNIIPDALQEAKDYTDNHVIDVDHITSESAASGKILTADGDGGAAWDDPSTPTIKAANIDSESAASGKILTADGAGGAAWDDPAIPTITASNIDSETATAGQVLTADGNGDATWQTPSGSNKTLVWSGSLALGSTVVQLPNDLVLENDKYYELIINSATSKTIVGATLCESDTMRSPLAVRRGSYCYVGSIDFSISANTVILSGVKLEAQASVQAISGSSLLNLYAVYRVEV